MKRLLNLDWQFSAVPLVVLRIIFGTAWLTQGLDKVVRSDWLNKPGMAQILNGAVQRPSADFLDVAYKGFLKDAVIPNIMTFQALIVFGELAIGIGLIIGLLTRPAAIGAMFLTLNYMLMRGALTLSAPYVDRVFFAAAVVFLVWPVGSVLGLDGWLARRLPDNGAVRAVFGPSRRQAAKGASGVKGAPVPEIAN